jgi:hypothetical protein
MKNRLLKVMAILCTLLYVVESCQKTASAPASSTASAQSLAAAISSLQAIAVGSASSSASASDSIYVIHTCSPHSRKDTIAFSSLPSGITNYLNTNYVGYTQQWAYTVTDSSGAAAGYVVIIQYNNSPVGLKFDASGNFVSVLEQKLGRELEGCLRDKDGGEDSTFTHHEHPYDSTHTHDGYDSTHVYDGDGSTHYNTGDSTHHHHH